MKLDAQDHTNGSDDCEEAREALPVEQIIDPAGMQVIDGMSWRELQDLSNAVQDRWYDVWVEDESPTPPDPETAVEVRQRLQDFQNGVPFIRFSEQGDLFSAIEAQLDPVWSLDVDTAEFLYTSLWLGIGELQTRKMTRLRLWWWSLPKPSLKRRRR